MGFFSQNNPRSTMDNIVPIMSPEQIRARKMAEAIEIATYNRRAHVERTMSVFTESNPTQFVGKSVDEVRTLLDDLRSSAKTVAELLYPYPETP